MIVLRWSEMLVPKTIGFIKRFEMPVGLSPFWQIEFLMKCTDIRKYSQKFYN